MSAHCNEHHCNEQWWTGEDSNLRSPKGRRVYSPLLLTAQPPVRLTCRPPCGTTLLTASVKAETESIAHPRRPKPTGWGGKRSQKRKKPAARGVRPVFVERSFQQARLAFQRPAAHQRQADQPGPDQNEGHGLGDLGNFGFEPILLVGLQSIAGADVDGRSGSNRRQ